MYFFVFHLLKDVDGVKISCYPTVQGYPVYTDILKAENGNKHQFVKLKKFNINVDLVAKTGATAQVIRETHIYLQSNTKLTELPFILCNGLNWSSNVCSSSNTHIYYYDIASHDSNSEDYTEYCYCQGMKDGVVIM